MKTLSVKQPWAYLLCAGIKDIENRTWALPEKYKGKRVLIHASKKTEDESYKIFNDAQADKIDHIVMNVCESYDLTSLIIGSVIFSDCMKNHPSIWAEHGKPGYHVDYEDGTFISPMYNWVVKEPILFDKPILNVKGKLSFWDFPVEEIPLDVYENVTNGFLPY